MASPLPAIATFHTLLNIYSSGGLERFGLAEKQNPFSNLINHPRIYLFKVCMKEGGREE